MGSRERQELGQNNEANRKVVRFEEPGQGIGLEDRGTSL
jgi:hypothetical protein